MDVKLQNAYVEVLLDNFLSVVKQNIMFQAQLEVMNSNVKEADEVKRKIAELSEKNSELQILNGELSKNLEDFAEKNSSLQHAVGQKSNEVNRYNELSKEKDRLQTAVNSYMRQIKTLEDQLKDVKSESQQTLVKSSNRLEELNKYIEALELSVPANKLKKIKVEFLNKNSSTEIKKQLPEQKPDDSISSGGTF